MAKLTFNISPEHIKSYWLIADTHFDHFNIIRYCHRPFNSTDEMNAVLLKNLAVVKPSHKLIYLGDVSFGRNSRRTDYWLDKIKAEILLIKGNHDRKGFDSADIYVSGLKLYLVHNPAYVDNRDYEWLIRGHKHDKADFIDWRNKSVCISVEKTGYKPIRLDNLLESIADTSRYKGDIL